MKRKSQLLGRLFRPYLIALAITVSGAMITAYFASVEFAKNNSYNSAQQFAQKTARQADMYISELDLLAEQVKRQPNIINTFYRLRDDNAPENYFFSDTLNSIDISSELKNLLAVREYTRGITVYNGSGDVVSSQMYTLNENAAAIASAHYSALIGQFKENNDTILFFPGKNIWTNSSQDYICLAKLLKNAYSDEICGIIEVRGSAEEFASELASDMNDVYTVSICDRSTGNVIYAPSTSDADNSNTVTIPLDSANWEIVVDYDTPVNTRFRMLLIIACIAVYALLLTAIIRILGIIGNHVTEPLMRLTERVHTINALDTTVDLVDDSAIDEIQELEDSFSKMLERINHLAMQEKKAYSLALQAQMNPHFLYNTLAVISSAGEEGGCTAVSDMCAELSDMLRYVAEYQTVTVPLRDEIEHTRNYLSLMKSRYEDYFLYVIDVDEDLMNIPMPKLCIQPLVENCFKHGFKEKPAPWRISVRMAALGNGWKLEIADNGTGISQETAAAITEQIDNAFRDKSYDSISGLGIANTIIRLKLTHDERVEYTITNNDGMRIGIISHNYPRGG